MYWINCCPVAIQNVLGPAWKRTELLAAKAASSGPEKIADALALNLSGAQDDPTVKVAREKLGMVTLSKAFDLWIVGSPKIEPEISMVEDEQLS